MTDREADLRRRLELSLGFGESASAAILKQEVQGKMRAVVDRLATADMELIQFRYFDGDSISVIAEKVGKSPAATKKAVQRAFAKLHELIQSDDELRDLLT